MFESLLAELEDSLRELKRMRDGARRKGFELEEIHRRMLHLERAIKLTSKAKIEFDKSLELPEDEEESIDGD